MSRPEKERTAALGGGVLATYKTNGYITLISEREVFEGEHDTSIIPPQEINLAPKGIEKLKALIAGPPEKISPEKE